jgi:hypothetical protein
VFFFRTPIPETSFPSPVLALKNKGGNRPRESREGLKNRAQEKIHKREKKKQRVGKQR